MSTFQPTTTTFRQGARTLPREYYASDRIFDEERELLFARTWNCVGRTTAVQQPGDYVLAEVAGESIIVLRDRQGRLRAFFNVCRHRGTRLCEQPAGHFSETIQCPYHAWTYMTDGRLVGAPHMNEIDDFDKADYPLHAAAIAEWEGFLFVHVGEEPQPFDDEWKPMIGRLERFNLHGLHVGHRVVYDVHANWKLVFQNYSECLHCPMIHPQLNAVLPYQSGANDLTEGPFLGGYMRLTEPNESATLSGRACGRTIADALPADDRRRAYYYTLMPNFMLSIHPDYVNYYLLSPIGATRTIVTSEWMFHPENAGSESFNPDDAIGFWDVTNRQDWDIVERSQSGILSRRYSPGPYSPRESIPAAWDRAYLRMMQR
jgi:phenylpropionate dioxygenase-like ring-hydroxylating dioxygenase large terminal subunit